MTDITLTPGRMVHFVFGGQCRAAVVVRVWPDPSTGQPDTTVALAVFVDGPRDVTAVTGITSSLALTPYAAVWESAVPYDATGQTPRTWHWMEDEDAHR